MPNCDTTKFPPRILRKIEGLTKYQANEVIRAELDKLLALEAAEVKAVREQNPNDPNAVENYKAEIAKQTKALYSSEKDENDIFKALADVKERLKEEKYTKADVDPRTEVTGHIEYVKAHFDLLPEDMQSDFNISSDVFTNNLLKEEFNTITQKEIRAYTKHAKIIKEAYKRVKHEVTKVEKNTYDVKKRDLEVRVASFTNTKHIQENANALIEYAQALMHSPLTNKAQAEDRFILVSNMLDKARTIDPNDIVGFNGLIEETAIKYLEYSKKYSNKGQYGSTAEDLFFSRSTGSEQYSELPLNNYTINTSIKPSSIEEVFVRKSTKPKGFLAIIPAFIEYLKNLNLLVLLKPKNKAFTHLNIMGINDYVKFHEHAEKVIQDILPDLYSPGEEVNGEMQDRNYGITRLNGQYVGETFTQAPLHYLRDPDTGKLRSNVTTAITMEFVRWIATRGGATITNTDEDIAKIVGATRISDVQRETLDALRKQGTLRKNFVEDIGPKVLSHLNLKIHPITATNGFSQEILARDLGILALEMAYRMDYLQDAQELAIPGKRFNELRESNKVIREIKQEAAATQGNAKRMIATHRKTLSDESEGEPIIHFVRIKTIQDNNGEDRIDPKLLYFKDIWGNASRVFEEYANVKSNMREALTVEDKDKAKYVPTDIDGAITKVDAKTEAAYSAGQQHPVSFNKGVIDLIQGFHPDAFKRNFLEYTDLKDVLEINEESQEAKNRDIDKEYDELMRAYRTDNRERYVTYYIAKNMRAMVDSNVFSVQSFKGLQRIALTHEAWQDIISNADLKQYNRQDWNNVPESIKKYLLTLGFSLGLKDSNKRSVDKTNGSPATWKAYHEALTDPNGKFYEAVQILRFWQPGQKFTEAQTKVLSKAVEDGGERAWSLASLRSYAEFENALEAARNSKGATFTHSSPMEVDGLTNAVAFLMMQMPGLEITQHTWDMINRTGLFRKDQKDKNGNQITSFGQLLEDNPSFLDTYQDAVLRVYNYADLATRGNFSTLEDILPIPDPKSTNPKVKYAMDHALVQQMFQSIGSLFEDGALLDPYFEDGTVTKEGRNSEKQPVMISGVYGAGEESVKNLIGVGNPYETAPLQVFYKKLLKLGKPGGKGDAESRAKQIVSMIRAIEMSLRTPVYPPGMSEQAIYFWNSEYVSNREITPDISKFTNKEGKFTDDSVWEFARKFKIPSASTQDQASPAKALENRMKDTYGALATKALKELLGSQKELQQASLQALKIVVHANKAMFLARYKKFVDVKGRHPSIDETREIQEKLNTEGWGTVFRHANSDTKKDTDYSDYLDFGKTSPTNMAEFIKSTGVGNPEDAQARLGIKGGSVTGVDTISRAVYREMPDPLAMGVAAIPMAIQSMDAATISRIFEKYKIFQVFDAFITGTASLEEVGLAINKAFIEINQEYSFMEAVNERLETVIDLLSKTNELTKDDIKSVETESFRNSFTKEIEGNFESFYGKPLFEEASEPQLNTYKSLVTQNEANRQKIFSQIGVVNQYSLYNVGHVIKNVAPVQNTNVFGSSEQRAGPRNTNVAQAVKLTQHNARRLIDDLRRLDNNPPNVAHQIQLDEITNEIILPLLGFNDRLTYILDRNPNYRQNVGEFDSSTNEVYVQATGNSITSPIDLGLQETAVHEYIHAVTTAYLATPQGYFHNTELEKLFNKAKTEITWKDFLPNESQYTQYEESKAKDRYDYIFNNAEGHRLEEFMAIGLTNQQFANALAKISYGSSKGKIEELTDINAWKSNPLKQLWNIIVAALEMFSSNVFKTKDGNIHSSLLDLTKNIVKIQHNQQQQVLNSTDEAYSKITTWANEGIRKFTKKQLVSKLHHVGPQNTPNAYDSLTSAQQQEYADLYIEMSNAGYNMDFDKVEFGRRLAVITRGFNNPIIHGGEGTLGGTVRNIKDLLENTLKGIIGNTGEEIYNNLKQDLTGLVKGDRIRWRNLRRWTETNIDSKRDRVANTIQDQVAGYFDSDRKMRKDDWIAINETLLRLDISSLMGKYNLNQIADLIEHVILRNQEIRDIESSLKSEYGSNGYAYIYQAKNLGMMISKGLNYANVAMPQTNAYAIANLMMFAPDSVQPVGDLDAAEKLIDHLATLYALEEVDSVHRSKAMETIRHEIARGDSNGIEMFLEIHNAFKDISREKNFEGNKFGGFKGYTSETYNSNITMLIDGIDPKTKKEMEDKGYKLLNTLKMDPYHVEIAGDPPNGLYISKIPMPLWRGQVVHMTNPHRRGNDIFEDMAAKSHRTKEYIQEQYLDNFTVKYYRDARKQLSPNFKLNAPTGAVMVPTYSQSTGKVSTFRYIMSDENKVNLLGREDLAHENIGRMFGSIYDKINTEKANNLIAEELKRDWEENKDKKDYQGNYTYKFRYIGLNAPNQAGIDAFRMLPDLMQKAMMDQFERKGGVVRDDLYNYIMGFREKSIVGGALWLKDKLKTKFNLDLKLPENVLVSIGMAESVWREITDFVRMKSSILLPQVVFYNMFSNALLLLADGIPPNYILSKTREGLHAMGKFQDMRKEHDKLSIEIAAKLIAGKTVVDLQKRATFLNHEMEKSPVKSLVDEGLFQVIVDAANPEAFRPSDRKLIQAWIGKQKEKLSEKFENRSKTVTKGIEKLEEVGMMPGSKLFAAVMAANQYGDFVARYVKFSYDTQVRNISKQDAIDNAMDDFIYYSEPQDPYLTAMNDYGLLMFAKFYMRIQRVIFKLLRQKPATTVAATVADNIFLGDQGVVPYFLNVDKLTNRMSAFNPVDHVADAFGLPIINWAKFIIPGW